MWPGWGQERGGVAVASGHFTAVGWRQSQTLPWVATAAAAANISLGRERERLVCPWTNELWWVILAVAVICSTMRINWNSMVRHGWWRRVGFFRERHSPSSERGEAVYCRRGTVYMAKFAQCCTTRCSRGLCGVCNAGMWFKVNPCKSLSLAPYICIYCFDMLKCFGSVTKWGMNMFCCSKPGRLKWNALWDWSNVRSVVPLISWWVGCLRVLICVYKCVPQRPWFECLGGHIAFVSVIQIVATV